MKRLQRDIRELQIEHDLLKTASEVVKKELGGDLRSLSNRRWKTYWSRSPRRKTHRLLKMRLTHHLLLHPSRLRPNPAVARVSLIRPRVSAASLIPAPRAPIAAVPLWFNSPQSLKEPKLSLLISASLRNRSKSCS